MNHIDSPYLVFADDDDFYINPYFFRNAIECMKKTNSLSFYGRNILWDFNHGKTKPFNLGYDSINSEELSSSFQLKYPKPSSTFLAVFKYHSKLKKRIVKYVYVE